MNISSLLVAIFATGKKFVFLDVQCVDIAKRYALKVTVSVRPLYSAVSIIHNHMVSQLMCIK